MFPLNSQGYKVAPVFRYFKANKGFLLGASGQISR